MEELCARFLEAWEADRIDKLVLIPMFILDFLCIHPFNDGNGRMSRLLTLLLFYKAGYIVGKYISMEMLIEKTKETYYEALQASSTAGSKKFAVPTDTALAPARIISIASSADAIPPIPITGTLTTFAASYTMRTAIG